MNVTTNELREDVKELIKQYISMKRWGIGILITILLTVVASAVILFFN